MKTLYCIPLLLIVSACNSNSKPVEDKGVDTIASRIDTVQTNEDTIQDIDSANYSRYYNLLYGYLADFPKNLLTAQPEAGNGDGRVFTDSKGNAILTVYGSRLDTLSLRYKQDLASIATSKQNNITYQKLTSSFSVISGFKGDTIFYYKRIATDEGLGSEGLASIVFECPKVDSIKYKAAVIAVSRSLRKIKVDEEKN